MIKISIVFYSGSGHTKKLAEFVAEGANGVPGVQAEIVDVENMTETDWTTIHSSSGIIFGSPTYMGSVAGPFKTFMDKTGDFWLSQRWSDRVAAGFTVGTSPSGDKLNSLIQMSVFAAQHGMIWVGQNHVGSRHTNDEKNLNNAGSWLGLMAESDADKSKMIAEHDAKTARVFGRRVAIATEKWCG